MLRTAVIATLAAMAQSQTYVLNSGVMDFNVQSRWMGASPYTPSNLPASVSFGNANSNVVSQLYAGENIDVGASIMLNGNTRIIMNGSPTSPSIITFGGATSRSNTATFAPPTSTADPMAPLFDWNCNLNWITNNAIPAIPPCGSTPTAIPNNQKTYFTTTYGAPGATQTITPAQSSAMSTCPMVDGTSADTFFIGTMAAMTVVDCGSRFHFGAAPCQPAAITQSCAVNNGVVTGDLGPTVTTTGTRTRTVITSGPYAGQVFMIQGNTVVNVTASSNVSAIQPATATMNGIYKINGGIFNGVTGNMIAETFAPTSAPTNAPDAAAAAFKGTNGSILIIIIIVVAIIISAVVVMVVMKKKPSQDAAPYTKDASRAAFDNPIYNEETSTDDVGEDSADGYMDVPANGAPAVENAAYDEEATDGMMYEDGEGMYEDAATSGYMDVGAEPDDAEDF
eukprot:m.160055 g.160055  ORF g.160055 m.160055 type:complete len:452 (+) comp11894_c0_seq1:1031-2386(+)